MNPLHLFALTLASLLVLGLFATCWLYLRHIERQTIRKLERLRVYQSMFGTIGALVMRITTKTAKSHAHPPQQ